MTDRFYSSHYGKHSTYYGMNSSSLYGSNFSSVFADAPPPLEDFHEEDDDMVFRNNDKSSPRNEEKTSVASNIERQGSSPDKMLKLLSNGESCGNEDDEFGDFSGFANFSSAFSTSDCSGSNQGEWCVAGLNKETKISCANNTTKSRSSGSVIETSEKNANIKSQPTFAKEVDGDAAGDEDDFADFEEFNGQKESTNGFGCVSPSWNPDNGNERQTSPLSPEIGISCSANGILAESNQITKQNDELETCDNLNGEDLENAEVQLSNDKDSDIERKSSNSFSGDENTQPKKYIDNKSTQRDLQQSPNIDSNAEIDNSLISTNSLLKEKTPDYENDPVPENDGFGEFTSMDTNNQLLSVFSTTGDNAFANGSVPVEPQEFNSVHGDSDGNVHQSLILENNCTDFQKNFKHDGMTSNTRFQHFHSGSESASKMNKTKETIDSKINSSANEAVKVKLVDEDNDFGSFSLNDTSLNVDVVEQLCNKRDRDSERTFNTQENKESKSNNKSSGGFDAVLPDEKSNNITENTRKLDNKGIEFETFEENNFSDDPIPVLKCDETMRTQEESVKFKHLTNDSIVKSSADDTGEECDDFGDFRLSGNGNIGAFAEFEHKENTIDITAINSKNSSTAVSHNFISNEEDESVCDDKIDVKFENFGDFTSSSNNNFGAFADFEHKESTNYGAATFSNHSTAVAADNFISNEERTGVIHDEFDDFGDFNLSSNNSFGVFADFEHNKNTIDNAVVNSNDSTTVVSDNFVSNEEDTSDDFAGFSSFGKSTDNWANFSAKSLDVSADRDCFEEFSSSQTGVDECRSAGGISDSHVSTNIKRETKTKEAISFSQNIKAESAISDVQCSTNQHKSKPEDLFKPGSKVFLSQTCGPVKLAFTSGGQLSGKGMKISPIVSLLSTSSVSDIWKGLQSSSKNGSIRFQWLLCHSQHKQLLALDVVPDHLPVTSLLFPGDQGQKTNLPFMSGPDFVSEPDSSSVISFRNGVKDVDPSQDPFGAPPEVGLPDLSFKFSNSKFPDIKSENGSSGAMALDLDFLATPSTPDMTHKQEHKGIYEEDLLELDMGFSLDPQGQVKNVAIPTPSPKTSDSNHLQKVFKFGNVTIPLEHRGDEKKLSDKAKEIVSEMEDLSFMLSSVLMFPLKSR